MMKQKISKGLTSYIPVRRGDWVVKVSSLEKSVLVVARHYYDFDKIICKYFYCHDKAADYILKLAKEPND